MIKYSNCFKINDTFSALILQDLKNIFVSWLPSSVEFNESKNDDGVDSLDMDRVIGETKVSATMVAGRISPSPPEVTGGPDENLSCEMINQTLHCIAH